MANKPRSIQHGIGDRIAELCDRFAEEIRSGRQPNIDQYVFDNSECGELLRSALHAVRCMVRLNASSHTLSIGSTLGGFRLTRYIAQGGMGLVYEAEQLELGRQVALKILPEPGESVLANGKLDRFQNEVRAAAALDHPHIVPIYSTHCEKGRHYFAMKLIDGITWSQWRDTGPVPDPMVFARELLQLTGALAHAHQRGIVHRDIKPSNVMRDSQAHTWITDFGLATFPAAQSVTATGELVGTLRYMSPEQASAGRIPIDHRTDIYSLGVTAFEVLTGHPAFDGDSAATQLRNSQSASIPPVRRFREDIPEDLETILLTMSAKDPQDRYASAERLADDLQLFLNQRSIKAKRLSMPQHLVRWAKERAGWLIVITTTLVALVLIQAFLVYRLDEAMRRAETNASEARTAAIEATAARVNEGLRTQELAKAKKELERQLQLSLLSQAEVLLSSHRPGRRFDTLAMLDRVKQTSTAPLPDEIRHRIERVAVDALSKFDARIENSYEPFAHTTSLDSCDFTPDLQHHTKHEGAFIQVHDSSSGQISRHLPISAYPMTCRFGSQGKWLGVMVEPESDPLLEVWDWRNNVKCFTASSATLGSSIQRWAIDIDDTHELMVIGLRNGHVVGQSTQTGAIQFRFSGPACPVGTVRLSPDGSLIAATYTQLRKSVIWNCSSGRIIQQLTHAEDNFALAWSLDSQRLACGTGFSVDVFDLARPEHPLSQIKGGKDVIAEILMHPSENLLAYHGYDGKTRFVDLGTGETLLEILGHCNRFSSDGLRLTFRTPKAPGVWQLADEKIVWTERIDTIEPHTMTTPVFARMSDQSSVLLLGCQDGQVLGFDPGQRRQIALGVSRHVSDLNWLPRSEELIALSENRLWTVKMQKPDSQLTAENGERDSYWHESTLTPPCDSSDTLHAMAIADNKEMAVIWNKAGEAWYWINNNAWKRLNDSANPFTSVAIDTTGKWIAAGRKNGAGCEVYFADDTNISHKYHIPVESSELISFVCPIPEIADSPTQIRLIVAEMGCYRCWSISQNAEVTQLWSIERPQAYQRHAIACAPDGTIALSLDRQTIGIVNAQSGRIERQFEATAERSIVLGLGFSDDSQYLTAALGADGMRTWDLAAIRTFGASFTEQTSNAQSLHHSQSLVPSARP